MTQSLIDRLRANADPRCNQHIRGLSSDAATLIERQQRVIEEAVELLEHMPVGEFPGKTYSAKIESAHAFLAEARATLKAMEP